MLDARVIDFLYRYVHGLGIRDVLRTVGRFPTRRWTPEEIARATGRPLSVVLKYLKDLTCAGVLVAEPGESGETYRLTTDPQVHRVLWQWVSYTDWMDVSPELKGEDPILLLQAVVEVQEPG